MTPLAVHPIVQASQLSLEQLVEHPDLSESAKVSELACQFEALLLRQILQPAYKPVIHSEFTSDSVTDDIYRDLITSQLAESISRSGSLGLARSLEQELTRQIPPSPSSGPKP